MYFTLFYLIELRGTFVFKKLRFPARWKNCPRESCHWHKTLVPAALWSVGSRAWSHCDVFNGRSPTSLTSLKLLRAIIEHVMIMSIAFVQCEEDETTSRSFFFKFNRKIRESILLRRCIKFNSPIRVWFTVIGLWATQSNHGLNFYRRLALIAVLINRAQACR